jgi:hypothetical protein
MDRVYRAVAWQHVDQISYSIVEERMKVKNPEKNEGHFETAGWSD